MRTGWVKPPMDDFCIAVPRALNDFIRLLGMAARGAVGNNFYDRFARIAAFGGDRHGGWTTWIRAAVSGEQSTGDAVGGRLERFYILLRRLTGIRQYSTTADDSSADPKCGRGGRCMDAAVNRQKNCGTD